MSAVAGGSGSPDWFGGTRLEQTLDRFHGVQLAAVDTPKRRSTTQVFRPRSERAINAGRDVAYHQSSRLERAPGQTERGHSHLAEGDTAMRGPRGPIETIAMSSTRS